MKPTRERNTEYQIVAPFYDLIIAPLLFPEYREAQVLTREMKARTAIDLCCGTGALAKRLAGIGLEVTGVDLSRDMLRQARKAERPNLTFLRKNAAWTGLPSGRFDLAIISMALHEKPPELRQTIIAEARRLIVTHGHILLIDYTSTPPSTFPERFSRLCASAIERLAGREHYAHYRSFIATGGLDGLIDRTGLTTVRQRTFHRGVVRVCLTRQRADLRRTEVP
jgi:demethylmenaquinone methyltransferase/2-methoxy-6-polyprenyl-1,4-benzoquinol methylase